MMTGTEVATVHTVGGSLAINPEQSDWLPVQRAALASIGIETAPEPEQRMFLHYCQRTGLDPFSRQIYMISRREWAGKDENNRDTYKIKWTVQTGIDGFRIIAARTRALDGPADIEWCGRDGVWHDVWRGGIDNPPWAARATVYRKDMSRPTSSVVLFHEFAGRNNSGNVTKMWRDKAAWMIGKCAEAAALRKAFPNDLGGMYTDDEMHAADNPQTGPSIPGAVDGTVVDVEPGPDWPTMIAEREKIAEQDPERAYHMLGELHRMAQGMVPNDLPTLELIGAAGARVKAQMPAEPEPPKPSTKTQRAKIAHLCKRGGIADDGAVRMVAALIVGGYERDYLPTLDALTREGADKVIATLTEWGPGGDEGVAALRERLVTLLPGEDHAAWEPYNAENAEQPEQSANGGNA